jgi:hypothetical protein
VSKKTSREQAKGECEKPMEVTPIRPFYASLSKAKDKLSEYSQDTFKHLQNQILDRQNDAPPPDYVFTILYLVGLFLFSLLIVMIQSFFVMIFFNYTIPYLFGLDKVRKANWLNAMSLLVLIRILFF